MGSHNGTSYRVLPSFLDSWYRLSSFTEYVFVNGLDLVHL